MLFFFIGDHHLKTVIYYFNESLIKMKVYSLLLFIHVFVRIRKSIRGFD